MQSRRNFIRTLIGAAAAVPVAAFLSEAAYREWAFETYIAPHIEGAFRGFAPPGEWAFAADAVRGGGRVLSYTTSPSDAKAFVERCRWEAETARAIARNL